MGLKQLFSPVKSMDSDEARRFIESNDDGTFTIIDVRQPAEYEEYHIPGAMLIPLPELHNSIDQLNPEIPVIMQCAVGGRSPALRRPPMSWTSELRAGSPLTVSGLILIPIEKVRSLSYFAEKGCWVHGLMEPAAVLVCSDENSAAFDMDEAWMHSLILSIPLIVL